MNIIFVTGNENKINEANVILGEIGYNVEGLFIDGKRPNFVEPQSDSLMEVALSKISQTKSMIKNSNPEETAILVEDSGFFINSIGNFPGVFSSFVYDKIGLTGVLKLLINTKDRSAEYRSVSILDINGRIFHSTGVCKGEIAEEESGNNGFGYDPIFIPLEGNGRTFSQMTIKEKSTISHRRKSLRGLLKYLKHPSK